MAQEAARQAEEERARLAEVLQQMQQRVAELGVSAERQYGRRVEMRDLTEVLRQQGSGANTKPPTFDRRQDVS